VLGHPDERDGPVVDHGFGFEGEDELFAGAELGGVGVGEVFAVAPVASPEGFEEEAGTAAGDPEDPAEDEAEDATALAWGCWSEGVGPDDEAV